MALNDRMRMKLNEIDNSRQTLCSHPGALASDERVRLQLRQRHELKRFGMCALEHDFWGDARIKSLLPAERAQAPAVAGFQTCKAVLGHGGAQVVPFLV